MSSLAATQADGYYHPPEYYTSGSYKNKSISKFNGSKGSNQWEQRGMVRFELPFDGFCMECGSHVGKGTRFNAKKTENGNYFTTKIYDFTTKCRICSNCTFVIRTNPMDRTFDYISGIKKKVEEFDPVEAGTHGIIDTDYGNKILPRDGTAPTQAGDTANDPLAKLEKNAHGERVAMTERDKLEALMKLQADTMCDDAKSNSSLRASYRAMRKEKKTRVMETEALGLGGSGVEIRDATAEDKKKARLIFEDDHDKRHDRVKKGEKRVFHKLRSGSIFGKFKRKNTLSSGKGTSRGRVRITQVKHEADLIQSKHQHAGKHVISLSDVGKTNVTGSMKNSLNVHSSQKEITDSSLSAILDYASDSDNG